MIAAVLVAVEFAVSGRYGYEQDEMFFLVAGRHLAFGYVDQPPLTPLLTRITDILGVSPTAVRVIPALAAGVVVVSAAKFAALFGAGCFGRILAALATACAPVVVGAAHQSTTTPLDLLAWTMVLLSVTIALSAGQAPMVAGRGRIGAVVVLGVYDPDRRAGTVSLHLAGTVGSGVVGEAYPCGVRPLSAVALQRR